MTDATNDESRVAEIRGRWEAATGHEYWHRTKGALIHDDDCGVVAEVANDVDFGFDNAAEFIAHAPEDTEFLLDQRDRYKAAVDAVMDIHYDSGSDLNSSPGVTWCAGCGNRAWPCPTIKAITDALGGDS